MSGLILSFSKNKTEIMYRIRCALKHNALSTLKLQRRPKTVYDWRERYFSKKNLALTNCISSGIFMALGDLIQQEIEYQYKLIPERYDWARALRMLTVGCLVGPLHHYYYLHLDRVLPGATLKITLTKILADQLFASPATIVAFFYMMGVLENKSLHQCTDEIKLKFKYVYLGDWCFWPPVQFINFYYLPTQYRVFYINFVTMIFNIFLSYIKHYDQH